MSVERIRRHYRFFGDVQGVGFRRRAANLARKLAIVGWVKNSSDGSVEMEAEGSRQCLAELLEGLETGWFIRIERMDVREIPVRKESEFLIV